jgi:hypothetical protein
LGFLKLLIIITNAKATNNYAKNQTNIKELACFNGKQKLGQTEKKIKKISRNQVNVKVEVV